MNMTRHERGRQSDDGFTLFELLVVLGIIALAYGLIAAPSFRTASKSAEIQSLARVIASQARAARSIAIASGQTVDLTFDVQNRRYKVGSSGRIYDLPTDVSVSVVGNRAGEDNTQLARLTFFPDGSSAGGQVLLQRQQKRAALQVDWLTGAVKVETP